MIDNKTIAVVIPAYNEEFNVGNVISSIPKYVDSIIVIDDGSTDNTKSIAETQGAYVISHHTNRGVGAAFKTGVQYVLKTDYNIMVNIDGDGQFNPTDIKEIITSILEDKADFVSASRFIDKNLYPEMPRLKLFGNIFMAWFISRLSGNKYYDVSCGFRAYSKEALQRLNLFGDFTYTQETFLDLAFKGLRIIEVPVFVRGTREFGKSKMASNLFKYAFQTLKIILKTLRDHKPIKLFGYFSLIFFIPGIFLGVFLFSHYFDTGSFTPFKWIGFTSAFLIFIGLIFILLGFILDMFARMRKNQEEMLFRLARIMSK